MNQSPKRNPADLHSWQDIEQSLEKIFIEAENKPELSIKTQHIIVEAQYMMMVSLDADLDVIKKGGSFSETEALTTVLPELLAEYYQPDFIIRLIEETPVVTEQLLTLHNPQTAAQELLGKSILEKADMIIKLAMRALSEQVMASGIRNMDSLSEDILDSLEHASHEINSLRHYLFDSQDILLFFASGDVLIEPDEWFQPYRF